MSTRSAAALRGIRQSGVQRFVDPTAVVKVHISDELFVVADACSNVPNRSLTGGTEVVQTAAWNALDAHLTTQPSDRGKLRVVPRYLVA